MCCQRNCPVCDGNLDVGRFGHHPDPAVDFCEEVDQLKGIAHNVTVGFGDWFTDWIDLDERIFRAMSFRVGGNQNAVAAKGDLRKLALSFRL